MTKKHRKFTIIIDTREKSPYFFGSLPTLKQALSAGDYSIEGHEDEVAVERKTLDDFVSTVIQNRKRFAVELKKLSAMPHSMVIVEASLDDVWKHTYTSKAHPNAVLGSAISLQEKWRIPVIWANRRQTAMNFTARWLRFVWERLRKETT